MMRGRAALATLMVSVTATAYAQQSTFRPPRLLTAELSVLPAPTIIGGGEVLIEATVDRRGALRDPIVLRGTPPYTQMVLDALSSWRFEPARVVGRDGIETTVEMPVTIGAIYRPPVLMNAPTIGEPARDWSKPSGDVAYPISIESPNYPPLARDGGVVLLEVTLNESGGITETRGIASTGGFESASREALTRWRFRGGTYRATPVPSTAYVLFGFRPPVGLAPVFAPKPMPLPPKP